MTALTKDRDTPERDGRGFARPVAAGKKIYAGALVALNATGYAEPGSTALNRRATGIAQETVDNTGGADGAVSILVKRGVFRLANDGTIARADIGATCYIVDDQTVAKADGGGTRSAAGTIRDVDAAGVWVEL